MVVSVSRRTDIPAFYPDWFREKLAEGRVLVKNPLNPNQVRTVLLDRSAVDAFVFWSKNPRPFLPVLEQLDRAGYPSYFQFTLNDYPPTLEPAVPPLAERLNTFKQLADQIGPDRIVWRYDPILFADGIDASRHVRRFAALAGQLSGCVDTCTLSFYTPYRKTSRAMKGPGLQLPDETVKRSLLRQLVALASATGITLTACCSAVDYAGLSVRPAACIDPHRLERLTGQVFSRAKDSGQRAGCRCIRSVDIGTYRTCHHGCLYCYAGSVPAI